MSYPVITEGGNLHPIFNKNSSVMHDDRTPVTDYLEEQEEFRDHLATVDQEGKRIWMYPKKPKGQFYNARIWVSLAFVIVFLALPFIKINGEQSLLFNVLERKFVIFGLIFTAQDLYIFGLIMLTFLVFIILFTVVFGRLFCGWVCPQTVFMEMIYRRIEYWIEGDYNAQRKLDQGPWTKEKIRKKALKHFIFFSIAVVVSNYFLAYIIGMDAVLAIIRSPFSENLYGFLAMIGFSYLFYGVFARLREQVCTTICPYGRLQGVLLVKDTIVIAYDHVRGEPRGKIKKQKPGEPEYPLPVLGDCVDCKLCIAVCPTGIDIRNGTQLECVNCTACIDACDEVMDKVGRKRGLIRYDSMTGIESSIRRIFTPRVLAYTAVLTLLIGIDIALLLGRTDVETIILRSQGLLYQEVDANHLSNLYTYQLINKTTDNMPIELRLVSPQGEIKYVGTAPDSVYRDKMTQGSFFITLDYNQLSGRKTPLVFEVYSNGEKLDEVKTNFMGPGR